MKLKFRESQVSWKSSFVKLKFRESQVLWNSNFVKLSFWWNHPKIYLTIYVLTRLADGRMDCTDCTDSPMWNSQFQVIRSFVKISFWWNHPKIYLTIYHHQWSMSWVMIDKRPEILDLSGSFPPRGAKRAFFVFTSSSQEGSSAIPSEERGR